MYAITATITTRVKGWTTTHCTPTFYLNSDVQGIRSENHAIEIARDIVNPFGLYDDVYITAVAI